MNGFNFELSLEKFYQLVVTNDAVFYSVIAATALLLILLIWRLARVGKPFDDLEDEADPDREKRDRMVDHMIEDITHQAPEHERIEEPRIQPVQPTPEDLEKLRQRRMEANTDTVEVLRTLSTDSAVKAYQTRPVGEAEPELVHLQQAPVPDQTPQPVPAETPKPVVKPEPTPKPKPKAKAEPKPKTLEEGLAKTKGGFINRLNSLVFGRKQIDDAIFEELEEILYEADIGPTATRLFDKVAEQAKRNELKDPERIRELLREEIGLILAKAEKPFVLSDEKPQVILMVGVNGVGKTTTIGKLAKSFSDQGKRVMLAAGDTFRAAAVEQLDVWGKRADVDVISAKEGANPSGVIYSAVEAAKAREVDVLIADTAGRLHTKYNLMEELRKMKSVAGKALGREPDEIWLVLDANTGQNAVNQAAKFHEALGLTGLILTKLDGTAKGGVVIGITDQLELPIRFIGIGEAVADLRPFVAKEFVEALF